MARQAAAEVLDKHIFSLVSADFGVRSDGVGVPCVLLVPDPAQDGSAL